MRKRSSWCNCEETRDEFGGCVPTEDRKTCIACGRKIPKNQLVKYKERMLKESGWDKEFEDEMAIFYDYEYYGIELKEKSLEKLFKKYLNVLPCAEDENNVRKVKIKCKDGCIQIERIDK